MDVSMLRAVVLPAPNTEDQATRVIEFSRDGQPCFRLKVVSRIGVDPKNEKGPIVIEPLTKECEALVRMVTERWNAGVDRLRSPL